MKYGVSRVLAAVFALSLIFDEMAYAEFPKSITIGYQNIPNGEIVAIGSKWYESGLGVGVKLRQFDSGRDVNTAFASNGIDIALLGSTPAAVGISSGIPYEVFWIHDIIGSAESLVVKNSSGVHDVAGLAGKKIATPFASTAHYSLLSAIKLAGLKESDVTVIDLQPQDIFAAWQRGDIDGAYVWHPTLKRLLEDGHTVIDSAELAKRGVLTADLGVVGKEFAKKYPELVTRYVKIQQKAVELYRAKPDEAASLIAEQFGITEEDALEQAGQLIWLTPSEQTIADYLGTNASKGKLAETLKSTADFLVTQGSIETAASLNEFRDAISTKFIEEASK